MTKHSGFETLTYLSLDGIQVLTLAEKKEELRACRNYPPGAP